MSFGMTRPSARNLAGVSDKGIRRRGNSGSFLGLSFDAIGLLLDGILLPENGSFISLVRRLGTKGVIRIGGNSSDHASLRMGLTIHRTQIEHLAAFLSATGWQLIYGLDLGSAKAEQAAAEAEMVARIVGPKLLAFQFGNEADLLDEEDNPTNRSIGSGKRLRSWNAALICIRPDQPICSRSPTSAPLSV